MENFLLIHDRGVHKYTKNFIAEDKAYFKSLNEEGWGIYKAVNEFSATKEEMAERQVKTPRNIVFLKKLRRVFADLDIAKQGDNQTKEQKDKKKIKVMKALSEKMTPSEILDTANGLQIFYDIDTDKIDEKTQQKYVNVINGIIEWSKTCGCAGDKVKDVTRVLRVEGYNHMKGEAYPITSLHKDDKKFTLEELSETFPYKEEEKIIKRPSKDIKPAKTQKVVGTEVKLTSSNVDQDSRHGFRYNQLDIKALNGVDRKIALIDIKDIVIKAFAKIGRNCDFDEKDRIVLDGVLTGGFQGKLGDRQYIGTTSHEPFEGNKITIVANILSKTNKESRQWIIDNYGLKNIETVEKEMKVRERADEIREEYEKERKRIDEEADFRNPEHQPLTWGNKHMDKTFEAIQAEKHLVLVGPTGGGKSSFAFDVAFKNAQLGFNILFLSLEMGTRELYKNKSLDYAGITVEEDRLKNWDDFKNKKVLDRYNKLKNQAGFKLMGISADDRLTADVLWDVILGEDKKPDLVVIDNLDLINIEGVDEIQRVEMVSKLFFTNSAKYNIPTLMLHHYNKSKDSKDKNLDSVRGSGKVTHNSDMVIGVARADLKRKDSQPEDHAILYVEQMKSRRWGRRTMAKLWYIDGTFKDEITLSERTHLITIADESSKRKGKRMSVVL